MIPVVSIVGSSNSGKTTLIERIIPELKLKDYKVGAIKHDAHHFDIDHQGKDTWRMTNSGADTVVISSHDKMAMIKTLAMEKSIDEIIDWLFRDVDIVITDLPYGKITNWSDVGNADNCASIFLESLYDVLPEHSVVAVISDKKQKVRHELYRRLEHFNVGKRMVTILGIDGTQQL
jgi:molybdopterin-guanine dinucleotide biosynthesis protein MobB